MRRSLIDIKKVNRRFCFVSNKDNDKQIAIVFPSKFLEGESTVYSKLIVPVFLPNIGKDFVSRQDISEITDEEIQRELHTVECESFRAFAKDALAFKPNRPLYRW